MPRQLSFPYVFVGGGVSAGYAAKEFVARGGQPGALAILGDEPELAYERPALSKGYLAPTNPARLPGFLAAAGVGGPRQDKEFYEAKGVNFLTSTRVAKADLAARTLTTASGDTVSFEKLIIGTGARAVTLADLGAKGDGLKGVHYLRDVRDADALVADIAAAKAAGTRAVVVGGGYIGMEVAAALATNGVRASVVFPESRLLERLFTPDIAGYYEKVFADKGIELVKDALVAEVVGEKGAASAVVLKDGRRLATSLVVLGIGARPNSDLFAGQLDLVHGGIKVDGRFRTSRPGVWAVGDVAAFPQLHDGAHARQEHVTLARKSGGHAVADLLNGEPGEIAYQPFFYSRFFNLSWQFHGVAKGSPVAFGDQSKGKFGQFWVEGGKIVGAFLEGGTPEEFTALEKLVAKKPAAPKDLGTEGLGVLSKL
ncbi:monodehydroascorbate reductase [Hyaloraphidium curvatum]|nr:monodehydroascorbate reductase [Hyaloraphidium curvatum]